MLINSCCTSITWVLYSRYPKFFICQSKLIKNRFSLLDCKGVKKMTEINISDMLTSYDKKDITIATVCSHSSLQIFNGARKEGFKTLGISVGDKKKIYDAFPLGKPDEFFIVDKYKDILKYTEELREKNVIVIRQPIDKVTCGFHV